MIPYGKHHIDEEDIQAVVDGLRRGALTQGPTIERFEQAIAEYVGAKYAVAVSSGTAGLHLAALAAGVGPSNSLITSPITFVASANAALYAGGRAVFADIDPDTINISPSSLSEALRKNPDARAVVPVHFAGLPCDMLAIKAAADQSGAAVIEDAAHALGAQYSNGQRVGSCAHSLMTVFSFHPVKAIAAGEGGMITTNDKPTYRITDIQCSLALSQFKKLNKFISRRLELVKAYDEGFADMRNCRTAQVTGRDQSGHHLYVLRINFEAASLSRGQLMRELRARKIGSQVHYIPVPAQPHYRMLGFKPEDYPNAQNYYQEALSIPLFYDLTDDQQQYVIATFKELLA